MLLSSRRYTQRSRSRPRSLPTLAGLEKSSLCLTRSVTSNELDTRPTSSLPSRLYSWSRRQEDQPANLRRDSCLTLASFLMASLFALAATLTLDLNFLLSCELNSIARIDSIRFDPIRSDPIRSDSIRSDPIGIEYSERKTKVR